MKRQRLYNERIKRGLTQEQVAKAIGISRKGYSHIETGRRGASDDVKWRMEDYFHISARDLLAMGEEKKAG